MLQSERGVTSILIIERIILNFQNKICKNRIFRSDFVKLGSEILYCIFGRKIDFFVLFLLLQILSDFGLLFFKLKLSLS